MKTNRMENPSGGNQTNNKNEIDIEHENEDPISISIDNMAEMALMQYEIDSSDNGNNLQVKNYSTDEDCDEFENLMTSKTIDDTAKAPKHRRDQEITEDIEEDIEMSGVERTEIDGKLVVEVDVTESSETRPSNTYAAKKTVAQGMMDIALLTANANQLRYAMELRNSVVVGLIIFSLVLQVSIGIAMILKGRMYLRGKSQDPITLKIDTVVVTGIFLITVINIFIASFTTTTGDNIKLNTASIK